MNRPGSRLDWAGFVSAGFIAVRVKNSLLPYRLASAFQETVEAAILTQK
jgi:hypothetical protein